MSVEPLRESVPLSRSRVILSLFGVNVMVLMSNIDISAVNVALPTMMTHLNTPFSTVQWVVISYMLVIACVLLQFARLGDMKSKKAVFFWGVFIFTAASAACGLSLSVGMLIACRAAQGVGAAMCQAMGAAIVTEVAGPKHRGKALGIYMATLAVGLMLGPSVGSFSIALWNWRAIFFINVPLGVVALCMIALFTPKLPPLKSGQRFDIPGAALTAVTLGSYCLGMTMSQARGFGSPLVLGLFAAAVVGFICFVLVEKRVAAPMINFELFHNPLFGVNLLVNFLSFISSACQTILPFYLQFAQGYSVASVGLFLMILPAAIAIFSPVSGALSDKYGTRIISLAGLFLLTSGLFSMTFLRLDTPWWSFALRAFWIGMGVGIFQAPNNTSIVNAAPRKYLGVASGMLSYTRVLGQNTGIPLVATIFAYAAASVSPNSAGANISEHGPDALVLGITRSYMAMAVILAACILLSCLAWRMEAKRKNGGEAGPPEERDDL